MADEDRLRRYIIERAIDMGVEYPVDGIPVDFVKAMMLEMKQVNDKRYKLIREMRTLQKKWALKREEGSFENNMAIELQVDNMLEKYFTKNG